MTLHLNYKGDTTAIYWASEFELGRSNVKAEDYKSVSTEKPKRKGKLSTSKRLMLAASQEWKPITSPKLLEAYSAKTEWAKNLIPKLKEEAEAPEEKEDDAED